MPCCFHVRLKGPETLEEITDDKAAFGSDKPEDEGFADAQGTGGIGGCAGSGQREGPTACPG